MEVTNGFIIISNGDGEPLTMINLRRVDSICRDDELNGVDVKKKGYSIIVSLSTSTYRQFYKTEIGRDKVFAELMGHILNLPE